MSRGLRVGVALWLCVACSPETQRNVGVTADPAPVRGAPLGEAPPDRTPPGVDPPLDSLHELRHSGSLRGRFQPAQPDRARPRGELRELQREQQRAQEFAAAQQLSEPATKAEGAILTFRELASFELPIGGEPVPEDTGAPALGVPPAILRWHGEEVSLVGYMYPLQFDAGSTSQFILAPTVPSCFYCQEPRLNEWVEVTCDRPVPVETQAPVLCKGTLEVLPVIEDGAITRLYLLRASGVQALEAAQLSKQ